MKKYFSLLMMAIAAFAFTACEDVPEPYRVNTEVTPEQPNYDQPINESFQTSLGAFESKAVVGTYDWVNSYSCAQITAYADNANHDAEAYLVTKKAVTLEAEPYHIAFEYILRYGLASTLNANHRVLVSTDYAGDPTTATWTALAFTPTQGSDWNTWYEADLDVPEEFQGKDITVALCYKATTEKAGTWEVRNFSLKKGTAGSGEKPQPQPTEGEGDGTFENPYNVVAAQSLIQSLGADVNSSEIYIKGKISEIKSIDTGYGNAEYYISDDGTTANQLLVYRGYGLNGDKFKSESDIKVGDEVVILGKVVNFRGNTPEVTTGSKIITLNGEGGGNTPTPTPGEGTGDGSLANPFNAVAAASVATALGTGNTSSESYYIKGIISEIKYTFDADHGTATFYISDDGTKANQFQVYSTLYLGNRNWTNGDTQIKVGDEVIIYGQLTNYNGAPETASKKSYIYSLNGATEGTPDVNPDDPAEEPVDGAVVFKAGTDKGTQTDAGTGSDKLTKGGVTLSVTKGALAAAQYRIAKGQTLTVSVASGKITSIKFTCTVAGDEKYGPGCFDAQEGYSYEDNVGTWTGSASSVSFTASANQVRATEIVVTVETAE